MVDVKMDRYNDMAFNARNAADIDTARKFAFNILKTAVLRTNTTVTDTMHKIEISSLLRDCYEVSGWDKAHREFWIGALHGAERMLKARAKDSDTKLMRWLRESLVWSEDILKAETITDLSAEIAGVLHLALCLERCT